VLAHSKHRYLAFSRSAIQAGPWDTQVDPGVRDPAQRDHSLTHVSDEPRLPARVVRISPKTFSGLFSITNSVSQKRSVSYNGCDVSERCTPHPAGRLVSLKQLGLSATDSPGFEQRALQQAKTQ
jgi:hypothetical protein